MDMHMRMGLGRIHTLLVQMLMMFIVGMAMAVFHSLVNMGMLMALGKMEPEPDPHQEGSGGEREPDLFAEQQHRDGRSHERGELLSSAAC